MRIAIVGSGISGLTAAYRLSAEHDVVVFEAGNYVGGHTHTVDVELSGEQFAVDTGFIVHNAWTYPNFIALMEELGVPWQDSDMSFSVHCERTGLEYNGTSLNALFAQRRNILSPRFLRMVADILRFNRHARALLASDAQGSTLSEFLAAGRYGRSFVEHYIVPMGAAIWSAKPCDMFNFPARFFLQFFANHGFLNVDERPVWRVIRGGSREYVKALTRRFADRIRLNCAVKSIQRQPGRVLVRSTTMEHEAFDQVFIACHSDQALQLLGDPSAAEREILGAIRYQENEAVLHTDTRLMPRKPLAWAAWNYHLPEKSTDRATVTYNMNILQRLAAPETVLLSLNRAEAIEERSVIDRFVYHHPVFTPAAIAAQRRRAEISGVRRTFYLGAYWGYGFHEDGVNSAIAALTEFEQQLHAQPHLQRVG